MLSFSLYLLVTFAMLLIGAIYATRKTVMPYHLDALESSWGEIDPKVQFMFKVFLNGGGYFGLPAFALGQ